MHRKTMYRTALLCGLLAITGSASASDVAKHKRGNGSIQGLAWFDANENGLRNRGESRLPDIAVKLLDEEGNELQSTTTNRRGVYKFRRLPINETYLVKFDISSRPDLDFTIPDVEVNRRSYKFDSDAVTIENAMGTTDPLKLRKRYRNVRFLDVGLIQQSSPPPANDLQICGRTWVDTDGDGVQTDGVDTLFGAIVITLNGPDGAVTTTTSDANDANYFFENLAPGTYSLSFPAIADLSYAQSLGDTWVSGDRISVANPQTGNTIEFTLPEDGNSAEDDPCTLTNIDAGYEEAFTPPVPTVATDDDASGVVGVDFIVDVLANDTAAEDAVDSVTIDSHDVPGDVTVDGNNAIAIGNTTAAGDYVINYTLTSDNGTSDSAIVTVTLTDPPPPAEEFNICGRTFLDSNGNDIRDEVVLNGVSVTLLAEDGSVLQGPVTTAAGGKYEFTGVTAGNYTVTFDLLAPQTEFSALAGSTNPVTDSDVASVVNSVGSTALITFPILDSSNSYFTSRENARPIAVCSVNWIDAGLR